MMVQDDTNRQRARKQTMPHPILKKWMIGQRSIVWPGVTRKALFRSHQGGPRGRGRGRGKGNEFKYFEAWNFPSQSDKMGKLGLSLDFQQSMLPHTKAWHKLSIRNGHKYQWWLWPFCLGKSHIQEDHTYWCWLSDHRNELIGKKLLIVWLLGSLFHLEIHFVSAKELMPDCNCHVLHKIIMCTQT